MAEVVKASDRFAILINDAADQGLTAIELEIQRHSPGAGSRIDLGNDMIIRRRQEAGSRLQPLGLNFLPGTVGFYDRVGVRINPMFVGRETDVTGSWQRGDSKTAFLVGPEIVALVDIQRAGELVIWVFDGDKIVERAGQPAAGLLVGDAALDPHAGAQIEIDFQGLRLAGGFGIAAHRKVGNVALGRDRRDAVVGADRHAFESIAPLGVGHGTNEILSPAILSIAVPLLAFDRDAGQRRLGRFVADHADDRSRRTGDVQQFGRIVDIGTQFRHAGAVAKPRSFRPLRCGRRFLPFRCPALRQAVRQSARGRHHAA